jgi:hypothetical protein
MRRGMRFREGFAPAFHWHATVARMQKTAQGMRPAELLANWPCAVEPLQREHTLRDAFEGTTHVVSGPYQPHILLQSGDLITSLVDPHGHERVRGQKSWSVIGRRHYVGTGDTDHLTIYVREET